MEPDKGTALDPIYPRFTRIMGWAIVNEQYELAWKDGKIKRAVCAFSYTATPNPNLLKKAQMLGNKGGKGMSVLVRT